MEVVVGVGGAAPQLLRAEVDEAVAHPATMAVLLVTRAAPGGCEAPCKVGGVCIGRVLVAAAGEMLVELPCMHAVLLLPACMRSMP